MFHRHAIRRAVLIAGIIAFGAPGPARAEDHPAPVSPTVEFGSPYAIRVLRGGGVVEVSGSFSWAVPQNFLAVLAQAPRVRTVRFDSPGGLVKPALEIASIIKDRGLDTDVERFCASACTLAFLGGHRRVLAPGAKLGFHQAHAPNVAPALTDPMMRAAYSRSGVPSAFIDHVLRTPPAALWFPAPKELQDAGITTETPRREADAVASPT
jgi:hypothetical protein